MTSDFMTLAADRIRIVLVGTQHPGNIGSAARAMKTMGLRRLVLVAPEKAPNAESDALAAGADDVLAAAEHFDDLASALAGCTRVMGCTARSRRVALPELAPRDAAVALIDGAVQGDVALVFGRERTGLTNDELHLCHQAVHIPANPDYSSLNLAAAVQVLAYETRIALLDRVASGEAAEPRDPPASHEQLEGFYTQLADTLDAIDFHKGRTPDSAMRKLRRIFNRAALDERDVRLLRGVLADAQRMARLAADASGSNGAPGA
ncbi:RNA methyltransferase [Cognatilysobacter terrigena]|uniref:RNA methyltransferase n=1 Tax=Cognatilysobacter terrigena TaxID=2488749 RepID=UPI003CCC7983